jgi:hypothetical protein
MYGLERSLGRLLRGVALTEHPAQPKEHHANNAEEKKLFQGIVEMHFGIGLVYLFDHHDVIREKLSQIYGLRRQIGI